ncbi:DMT family transporter [Paenibacillus sp. FSL K6-0108]|uniref:DMT family transporter n=1 Tax=Paenibacillus sp. FSL K6-0108 TaxID=2921417 RepID=UPI003244B4BE
MKPLKYTLLILVTTFIMGTSFPVGKIGMMYAPPFLLMGLRYILAGALLAWIIRKRPMPVGWKQWMQIAIIGLFQSAGVMGCAYYSMNWISSGESAIITFTNPLLVIILSAALYGVSYRFSQWTGVVLGFVGVALTFGFHLSMSPGTWIGFGGAVLFAVSTLLIKRWGAAHDTFVLTAYQMLAGGAVLLLLSVFTEELHFIVNTTSIVVLVWLTIFCSIIQFTLWFYLLQNTDPAKTSSFLFLAPLFGLLSSFVLLKEHVGWIVGAGGIMICLGIFLVNRHPAGHKSALDKPGLTQRPPAS